MSVDNTELWSNEAVQIPLEIRKFGIRVGRITDPRLVTEATWVLVVKTQGFATTLRDSFDSMVKIAPVEHIREVSLAAGEPGISLRKLSVAPRAIPYYQNSAYFELDRNGPYWAKLCQSGGVALLLNDDLVALDIECWAIPVGTHTG